MSNNNNSSTLLPNGDLQILIENNNLGEKNTIIMERFSLEVIEYLINIDDEDNIKKTVVSKKNDYLSL